VPAVLPGSPTVVVHALRGGVVFAQGPRPLVGWCDLVNVPFTICSCRAAGVPAGRALSITTSSSLQSVFQSKIAAMAPDHHTTTKKQNGNSGIADTYIEQ
jgi:hypothetical protein